MENSGKVIFGATVTVIDVNSDEEKTYQIVGDDEADIKSGRISVNSPIARGLIGKFEAMKSRLRLQGAIRSLKLIAWNIYSFAN